MFYYLGDQLAQYYSIFNLFKYLTFRVILATLTALSFSIFFGPIFIRKLKEYQIKQNIRRDGPESHLTKEGTPTMGGILILLSILASTLLWSNLTCKYTWICLFAISTFGLVGFYDDICKIRNRSSKGLTAKQKIFFQFILATVVAVYVYETATGVNELIYIIPFFKEVGFDAGIFFIIFSCFVIVGTSNAVNLSDGLDGLAIVPTIMISAAFIVLGYIAGNVNFSEYLAVPYVRTVGETCIFCGAVVGAGLGFLWFNSYPAEIFMGDVGSLGLGAALGTVAVLVRQELLLFIMGGVLVLETVSVILQVVSFKLRGKRVFKMAPIHHHFELKGWPEPKVIVRFWIMTAILVLIALATLKVR